MWDIVLKLTYDLRQLGYQVSTRLDGNDEAGSCVLTWNQKPIPEEEVQENLDQLTILEIPNSHLKPPDTQDEKLSRLVESQDNVADMEEFLDLLTKNQYSEAFAFYQVLPQTSVKLIDAKLDFIPWRVSCEYGPNWFNVWVKIGYWPPGTIEISPQLMEAQWDNQEVEGYTCIPADRFPCSVRSGVGGKPLGEILFWLLEHGKEIDVELGVTYPNGYPFWTPINWGYIEFPSSTSKVMKAQVEVGNLFEGELELDGLREFSVEHQFNDKPDMIYYSRPLLGRYMLIQSKEDDELEMNLKGSAD